eukprot:12410876-Karenia_brevis.AAC.1
MAHNKPASSGKGIFSTNLLCASCSRKCFNTMAIAATYITSANGSPAKVPRRVCRTPVRPSVELQVKRCIAAA